MFKEFRISAYSNNVVETVLGANQSLFKMDGGQFEIVKETVQTFTKPRNDAARGFESNIMGNMDYSMEMR